MYSFLYILTIHVTVFYTDTVGFGSPLEEDEGQQTSLSFAQVKNKVLYFYQEIDAYMEKPL